jgi:hypothetical protein
VTQLRFHEPTENALLHRIVFFCPATGSGQFLPPSLATAMEELASTPDAKAHNRCAAF